MKFATVILHIGIAAAGLRLPPLPPKLTDPAIPCLYYGDDSSCGPDTYCEPNNYSACANGLDCSGTCAFNNVYPSCGGDTIVPIGCRRGSKCVDDPRTPGSCGMACDGPGICVSERQPRCRSGRGRRCPAGLWCYQDLYTDCAGDGCPGTCL